MNQKSPPTTIANYQLKKQPERESLGARLRKITKNKPKLQLSPIEKNRQDLSHNPQINNQAYLYKTIQWGQSHLKEVGHAHKIPKAERFKSPQRVEINYPQSQVRDKRFAIKNGVTFAKSPRRQLFSRQLTPSGADYDKVRYLQESRDGLMSHRRRSLYGAISRGEHIRGGTFNRFINYEDLYYPHTKKLQYNEKQIKEMGRERKKRESKSIGY